MAKLLDNVPWAMFWGVRSGNRAAGGFAAVCLQQLLMAVLFFERGEFFVEELRGHISHLLVYVFAIDSGIVHKKLWEPLLSILGAHVEEGVMADTSGQNSELRAWDVGGEELRILRGRSNGIGGSGDDLDGNGDRFQVLGRKGARDGGSNGEDGSNTRITIGIAGML